MPSDVAYHPELKGTAKPCKSGYQADTSKEAQEWHLANDLCPVVMYSNDRSMRFWICAKPIKTDGASKCNTHLGVEKRLAKKDAEKAALKDAENQRRDSAQEYCDRLEAVGISAHPDFSSYTHKYTGGITIPARYLEHLLTLVEQQ